MARESFRRTRPPPFDPESALTRRRVNQSFVRDWSAYLCNTVDDTSKARVCTVHLAFGQHRSARADYVRVLTERSKRSVAVLNLNDFVHPPHIVHQVSRVRPTLVCRARASPLLKTPRASF